jgi:hypothetical protein
MKKKIILLLLVIIGCSSDDSINNSTEVGQGGSLARFSLVGNYLYTVDEYKLNVLNISDNTNPIQVNSVNIGFDIETLFNYDNYLYVGSRTGMYIYSIDNPESPSLLSEVNHFTACDPVIANETHAFVTLHTEVVCGNDLNVLEIYDISNVLNPILISSRNLIRPIGIGLYNDYLFVCDDEIKIFNISNPSDSVLVNSINKNAFDVIIKDNLLILIGENGLYQYSLDENNIENISELSAITI